MSHLKAASARLTAVSTHAFAEACGQVVGGGGVTAWVVGGVLGRRVQGAEHLLAALEMLGVENCRIEIEGGHEVPIVDGSAQGWCVEIQAVRPPPPPPKL